MMDTLVGPIPAADEDLTASEKNRIEAVFDKASKELHAGKAHDLPPEFYLKSVEAFETALLQDAREIRRLREELLFFIGLAYGLAFALYILSKRNG